MPVTTGTIGAQYHESAARVRAAIRKAGIEPVGYAGRYPLYAEHDIPKIASALRTMRRMVLPQSAEAR